MELFGLALGCIGLTSLEFRDLTPDEFDAVYQQWNLLETSRSRAAWEQSRLVAHCAVMPHVRRSISPTDLVRFDWDNDTKAIAEKAATQQDFERMKKRFED